jgi:hypothetical protein
METQNEDCQNNLKSEVHSEYKLLIGIILFILATIIFHVIGFYTNFYLAKWKIESEKTEQNSCFGC